VKNQAKCEACLDAPDDERRGNGLLRKRLEGKRELVCCEYLGKPGRQKYGSEGTR
jgi:hypothetical protein